MKRLYIFILLVLSWINLSFSQDKIETQQKTNFHTEYIVSGLLISCGITSFLSEKIRNIDYKTRDFANSNLIKIRNRSDDFIQFAPAATVYVLNALNVKGKHSWQNATIIYAGSMAIAGALVLPTKYSVGRLRPDNSAYNSFPSGHTATAFASAEFLRREYSDVSPWIGVAGYIMATHIGAMRVINNRHWLSDVVAGAGIGILSTSLSYYIYDNFLEPKGWNFSVTPVVTDNQIGISYTMVF